MVHTEQEGITHCCDKARSIPTVVNRERSIPTVVHTEGGTNPPLYTLRRY